MPAAADNPDGFWEHLRFVALNDEILSTVGAAWDLPPWEDERFAEAKLNPHRAKARLLIDPFQGESVWGWKDPRNSLVLPFWQGLLPRLKIVVMVRNPLEVAYSMHKRNGTSYALGLRLWELYNRRVLAQSRAEDRIITSYQAFFEDPETELRKIAAFSGLADSEVAEAATLVAADRRHTSFSVEQMIDAGVSEQIVTLFQELTHGATAAVEPRAEADQLTGSASQLNMRIPDGEDVRRELATRRGDEARFLDEIGRHQKTIEGLRHELNGKSVTAAAEINRRDGRIEELQKAYAHLDELLRREHDLRNELVAEQSRLQTSRQQAVDELAQVRERFTQTNNLLQNLSVRLSRFEMRNSSLTDRLRKQLLEMKKLLRLLDQVEDAASRLRHSRRWKIANPFHALLGVFTGKPVEGFGHLDKNVGKYQAWRSAHPETQTIDAEIQALRSYDAAIPALSTETPAPPRKLEIQVKPSAPTRPISFPRQDEAEVSIIIPVYNQVEFTLTCLASVQDNSGLLTYEVIVVDDCSTDSTPESVGNLSGVIYLRAGSNAGFINSCNRGAAAARGKYLVFLNNDTTVTDGWLTALHDTFHQQPRAGLVGSKLVYPDGRLQEAGGIIWRDGSGWNRGKFQDADRPEFNYLREVDYCSAASVMIPKSLFDELGGFDTKYAPAYYEDTDLAFKVAQRGLSVLYQPLSVVIHHEGITSGTDLSAGAKKYQEINRSAFTSTWSEVLAVKPANGDLESYEQLKPGSQRILVIDHHLPMHDRDSGSLRMFQILTLLQKLGHRVTFLPDNMADIPPYGDDLRKRGIQVLHHPYVTKIADYLQQEGAKFDVIILSRCDFARKHIEPARRYAPDARLIFDTVDLHFVRTHREAQLTNDPLVREQAREKEEAEYRLIDQSDETWVVSTAEQELLAQERPGKPVHVVTNIVDSPGSATPFANRRDFLFIGSFQHTPNIDAVLFFGREILPLVRRELPTAKFFIIGDKAPSEVVALADENVIVTGLVPDARPYFDNVKLSVAPLRYGAGVKGKINQSMGLGVPVVATSIAVEGMDLTDRVDVIIADSPADFASRLVELYNSPELWNLVSEAGVRKTEAAFSQATAERQLHRLFSADRAADKSRLSAGQPSARQSHSLAPV